MSVFDQYKTRIDASISDLAQPVRDLWAIVQETGSETIEILVGEIKITLIKHEKDWSEYFDENFKPKKCTTCDSTSLKSDDRLIYISVWCQMCGETLGRFEDGSWDHGWCENFLSESSA